MLVLHIGLQSRGVHVTVASQGVPQLHRLAVVRHGVTGTVSPFPFAYLVFDEFELSAHAPCEGVGAMFPVAVMSEGDDACLKGVTRVLVEDTGSEHGCLSFRRVDLLRVNVTCRTATCRGIGEHVFAGDVEVLTLVGIETREVKTYLHFLAYFAFRAQGSEGGQELIFLLAVIVDG